MDESTRQRCITIAQYMLKNRATVRQAAQACGLSKSAVHKDMCQRLPGVNASLARQVHALLAFNKSIRHLRGGEATRQRYQGLQSIPNDV